MSIELDELARSLFNGQLPAMWRRLAPATKKSLGNWMEHFQKRNQQYNIWVKIQLSIRKNYKWQKGYKINFNSPFFIKCIPKCVFIPHFH